MRFTVARVGILLSACLAELSAAIAAGQSLAAADNAEALDWRKVAGRAQIVFLGETDHGLESDKGLIAESLGELRRLGFTHLALEYFEARLQGALDDYFHGKTDVNGLHEAARGRLDPAYVRLLQSARANQVKVIALDTPREEGRSRVERNVAWARRLSGTLAENPKARILVVCGDGHLAGPGRGGKPESSVSALMRHKGCSIVNVEMAVNEGQLHPFLEARKISIVETATKLAKERGMGTSRALVLSRRDGRNVDDDLKYYLYVPGRRREMTEQTKAVLRRICETYRRATTYQDQTELVWRFNDEKGDPKTAKRMFVTAKNASGGVSAGAITGRYVSDGHTAWEFDWPGSTTPDARFYWKGVACRLDGVNCYPGSGWSSVVFTLLMADDPYRLLTATVIDWIHLKGVRDIDGQRVYVFDLIDCSGNKVCMAAGVEDLLVRRLWVYEEGTETTNQDGKPFFEEIHHGIKIGERIPDETFTYRPDVGMKRTEDRFGVVFTCLPDPIDSPTIR